MAQSDQARLHGWRFLDAAAVGELDTVDGIHWDGTQHYRFVGMLAPTFRELGRPR